VRTPTPDLVLSSAPFSRETATTPRIMLEVVWAALVVLAVACWTFGIAALLIVGAATAGAILAEWVFTRSVRPSPLGDYSALLTGLLLGLTLPPAMPLWMAFLGGASGIGLGKLIWGGLGQNLFNPALVGRAFLQAAFPTAITTWSSPVGPEGFFRVPPGLFAAPLLRAGVDAVSAATPLGHTAGSLGETSAAVLVLCGVWLGARRLFDWRLPVATCLSIAVSAGALHWLQPAVHPPPGFALLSGGALFAAVFMVTDPVTTPTTTRGAWIFGLGVGLLVVIIRQFGGLPEGVMYAILFMNALTPHINRFTQPRPFGA
jgi:electron transport complex protein RnfD